MKNKIFLIILVNFSLTLNTFAQQKGVFVDSRDRKVYNTVKIGTQWWMAENLAYDTKIGYWKAIPETNYGVPENGGIYTMNFSVEKFGYLYNYEASKIACPTGWRIPTKKDWQDLIKTYEIGNDYNEKCINVYKSLVIGGKSGFDAIPGTYIDTQFKIDGAYAINYPGYRNSSLWSSSYSGSYINVVWLAERTGTSGKETPYFSIHDESYPPNKNYAATVRCICEDGNYDGKPADIPSYGKFQTYIIGTSKDGTETRGDCESDIFNISDYTTNAYKSLGDKFWLRNCKGSNLNLSGIDFKVSYYFYNEILFEVCLYGYSCHIEDLNGLIIVFVNKYGDPTKSNKNDNGAIYIWENSSNYLSLEINHSIVEAKYWSKTFMGEIYSDFIKGLGNKITNESEKL